MVARGQLSRQEIARECGFAKSVLLQNPRVKEALLKLESKLRDRGLLPLMTPMKENDVAPPTSTDKRVSADKARLKRLESENASLRAEVLSLRMVIERYRLLDNALCSTGRIPR